MIAANPSLLERNLEALWRADPELAAAVDALTDDDLPHLEASRSGPATAAVAVPGANGAGRAYLHSRYDPLAEAETLVKTVDTEGKFCFVVSGLGLGYHVRGLYDRLKGDAFIIVSEPSLPLALAALMTCDLSDLLADGKLVILTKADKGALHAALQRYTATLMMGTQFVVHPASQRIAAEFHAQVRALITDYVAYGRMSLMTLASNSTITCRNIANNLGAYLCTPPIDMLRNRFASVPAIVVSAGPSLCRNINRLAEAAERAVIIAVQTTLGPLLQRGIRPHFVTSLDWSPISKAYFEQVGPCPDVHLIAEPKVTWHVIDSFRGPVSLVENEFARLLLGEDLAKRAGLPAGSTVAHLAFYLAQFMGCDPIVFVGQDLAYTDHLFYAPGVEIHDTWRPELNRFCTLEMKEWERIIRHKPLLRKIKDSRGEDIYTDDLLFTYLEQFEKDFVRARQTIINATEGGADIRGAATMTLQAVLDRYCVRPLDPGRFAYRRETHWFDPSRLEAGRAELSRRLSEVEEVGEICGKTLQILQQLEGLVGNPAEFNRRLARVDELRLQVRKRERAYRIINSGAQLAELRRFSADRRISAAGETGPDLALRQLARDQEFVKGIRDGAEEMAAIISTAMSRMAQKKGMSPIN